MSTASPPSALLTYLALPDPALLLPPQVRGATCVWCDTRLSGATALDLGSRSEPPILGAAGRWFPRGCIPCTLKHVLDETLCDTQRGLRALALELRRALGVLRET
ncbi:hypothetical protein [Streptomyces sp. NPDC091383]|uniref:hypothetical protein n=1 Tax=Streptomyces sp. NPDC091383 TaxID=3365996 RepID=UPI00382D384A